MLDRSQRQTRLIMVIALCVSVICLTVSYAVKSQSLKLVGNAKMRTADWSIHFDNISASTTGVATYTMPKMANTQLSNYSVALTRPGDSVSFTFDIVNDGNIDAVLGTLTKDTIECNSLVSDKDAETVCNNLIYTLEYIDGNDIQKGNQLLKGTHKKARLTIEYDDFAKEVPSSTVDITGLDLILIYEQY